MTNYPPFSWPGGSMLVDYDGRILAQADAGPGEKVVVAPVDIAALRHERERRAGHDMRAHLRSGMYPYLQTERLPAADAHPVTPETIKDRIRQSKNRCP